MIQVLLLNPEVIGRKHRTFVGFQEIKVSIEYAVGENVLDVLAQQDSTTLHIVSQQRFIQSLPDVTSNSTVDGCLTVTPYIYIIQVTFLHRQLLFLDRQCVYPTLAESHTGFL